MLIGLIYPFLVSFLANVDCVFKSKTRIHLQMFIMSRQRTSLNYPSFLIPAQLQRKGYIPEFGAFSRVKILPKEGR